MVIVFISLMFFAKIMQIECRTTSLLDCYAEMQLILCKDTFFPHTIQIFVFRFAGTGLHRNGRCRFLYRMFQMLIL